MKHFNRDQFKQRVLIFIENLKFLAKMIIKCITDKSQGKKSSRLGLTPLAFYSQKEIQTKILNPNILKSKKLKLGSNGENSNEDEGEEKKPQDPRCTLEALSSDPPILSSFSWKNKGFVSPVYEQGKGECLKMNLIIKLSKNR